MHENKLIAVPFHGNNLFIVTYNDEPYTPMKPIVEGMGLDWRAQASKFRSNKERWGVALITTPTNGSDQDTLCIPLRKLPGWLMTLQPSRVAPEIREKVVMYQNECDDALWDYWTKGQAIRRASISEFPLSDLTVRLVNTVQPMLKQYSLRQAYVIANHAIQADTGIDVLAHWPISLDEIDDTLPTLPGRKLPKPEASGKNPLDKLARYLRNAKHLPVPRQASKFTGEVIARLLGQGYIPRQMLLKVMHVPAAEFNLLIAEGKEAGIVRELDGIEFNYAGVVYVAGGAA